MQPATRNGVGGPERARSANGDVREPRWGEPERGLFPAAMVAVSDDGDGVDGCTAVKPGPGGPGFAGV
jgi:hypothetical protein